MSESAPVSNPVFELQQDWDLLGPLVHPCEKKSNNCDVHILRHT